MLVYLLFKVQQSVLRGSIRLQVIYSHACRKTSSLNAVPKSIMLKQLK